MYLMVFLFLTLCRTDKFFQHYLMLESRLKCYTHVLRGLAFMFKKENFPCSVLMAAISADYSC